GSIAPPRTGRGPGQLPRRRFLSRPPHRLGSRAGERISARRAGHVRGTCMSESNQPTDDQGNGRSDAVPGSGSAYGYGSTPPGDAPAPERAATPGPAPAPGSAAEHAVPSGSDPAGTLGPAAWGPAARGPSAPSAPAAPAPEAV